MNCRKVQEYLKTDYLDGEVGARLKDQIKEHLRGCAKCRCLEEALLSQRVLFHQAKIEQPPERIWQNVRNTIVSERLAQEKSFSQGIIERLKQLAFRPRPVFAVASACAVVIFLIVLAGTLIYRNQGLSKIDAGEIIVSYSLSADNGDYIYDLGTDVEEYFL